MVVKGEVGYACTGDDEDRSLDNVFFFDDVFEVCVGSQVGRVAQLGAIVTVSAN